MLPVPFPPSLQERPHAPVPGDTAPLNIAAQRNAHLPDNQDVVDIPRGQAQVESKSLDPSPALVGNSDSSGVGGMRVYRFHLEPGERVSLKMKAEPGGNLAMAIPLPAHMDEFTSQIQAVNREPRPMRMTHLGFRNTSGHSYDLMVLVIGYVNYAYRIDIEQSR